MTSPISDLILLSARLSLLHIHRHRKRNLIASSSGITRPTPTVLGPIVNGLNYVRCVEQARSTLRVFGDTLTRAHVPAIVVTRTIGADEADNNIITGLLKGKEKVDKLGTVLSLEMQGW